MVEFRAGFLEDKERLYEDMVGLCLDLDRPVLGLEYAERAKSRALVDLLAYHLDLAVEPRNDSDQPLTEKLTQLRTERDRIHRRWLIVDRLEARGLPSDDGSGPTGARCSTWSGRSPNYGTNCWCATPTTRLMRRSTRCERSPCNPILPADTLLLEWFIAHGRPILFLVTRDTIEARRLEVEIGTIQQLLALLWLNLGSVRHSASGHAAELAANAQRLLRKLHDALIAPVGEIAARYPRWIIVPHGLLHYLPFHALHDGRAFLVEEHEISYLPGSSLLRYCCRPRPEAAGLLALGYSCDGRLPFAVEEAQRVAAAFGGEAYVDDAATVARLRETAGGRRVIHLATHGDFRADNPLFSGLALADGWLSTLDCFNLRLAASLVTLSGCQTGRSVVGGGDELLGLTRALLSAGAASLVLSLWAVEDASTARLMEAFYTHLAAGCTKGEALRQAQLGFIRGQGAAEAAQAARDAHPYFWAPFALVGDAGAL